MLLTPKVPGPEWDQDEPARSVLPPAAVTGISQTTRIDEIAVVIPAKNEEALLAECLSALERAIRGVTLDASDGVKAPTMRVILVLDSCTDASAEVAARWPWVETVIVEYANVGRARAHGVEIALRGSSGATPSRLWIANTDADSQVPAHWITRQLEMARSGIRLIIGSVRPDPRDLTPTQRELWAVRHPVDSTVRRIYGANLGVRADGYLLAGGFPAIAEHEDVVLVDRLHRVGVVGAVSHSCWVQTSARTVGRTPGGFAAHVRENY